VSGAGAIAERPRNIAVGVDAAGDGPGRAFRIEFRDRSVGRLDEAVAVIVYVAIVPVTEPPSLMPCGTVSIDLLGSKCVNWPLGFRRKP